MHLGRIVPSVALVLLTAACSASSAPEPTSDRGVRLVVSPSEEPYFPECDVSVDSNRQGPMVYVDTDPPALVTLTFMSGGREVTRSAHPDPAGHAVIQLHRSDGFRRGVVTVRSRDMLLPHERAISVARVHAGSNVSTACSST